MKRQLALTGLLVVLLLMTMRGQVPSTSAQSVAFEKPVLLSPDAGSAWFPDIAVDPYGDLHVVWTTSTRDYDQVMYTTSRDGIEWAPVNDIKAYPTQGEALRPTLLTTSLTQIMLSDKFDNVRFSRNTYENADNAISWSDDLPMFETNIGYYSRMAMLPDESILMVYTENVQASGCPTCYVLMGRTSPDMGTTWSEPVAISQGNLGAGKPNLWVDSIGVIHLVWESGIGGGLGQINEPTRVRYARSTDNGKTWSMPLNMVPDENEDLQFRNIVVGQDGMGNLLVAYWGLPSNDVYYVISKDNGESWEASGTIPDVQGTGAVTLTRLDAYTMAVDSSGFLHLAMVGQAADMRANELAVMDVIWDGNKWHAPAIAVSMRGDVPEWPKIAISNGNQINITYFVRNESAVWESDAVDVNYKIWYVRGFAPSPFRQPLQRETTPPVEQTETPTPTETLLVELPTMTQTATIEAIPEDFLTPQPAESQEGKYVRLIGFAAAPVVLLILVVVVVVFIRKRMY